MKKIFLLSALLATSFGLSSCGYVHNHHGHHDKRFHDKHAKYMKDHFKKADKNNDGFISKEEHEQCSNTKFSKMDLNKDSKISKEEMDHFTKAIHKHHRKRD